jgi:hypothetical protein
MTQGVFEGLNFEFCYHKVKREKMVRMRSVYIKQFLIPLLHRFLDE